MAKKFTVTVVPNAKRNEVKEENGALRIRVNATRKGGKANAAVVKLLAGHFGVSERSVRIIAGAKSRRKVIEINL